MNVNSVTSTYNTNSLWNNISSNNSSTSTAVDSAVKPNYSSMNYLTQTTSDKLQDTYKHVDPNYAITLTYNQNATLSTNELNKPDSNIVSSLNNGNSTTANSTFKSDVSSILASNPTTLYNAVDSLGATQTQNLGNYINTLV